MIAAARQAEQKIPPLKAMNVAELLAADIPPREYMLDPLIPTQSLSMIYAPRGLGKTFLALHIAYAIATGHELFGWRCDSPYRVLYLDGEMPAVSLQERLAAIIDADDRDINLSPTNLTIVPQEMQSHGMPDLASLDGQVQYDALVVDADLVIVDNISTLCRSSAENKADDWTVVSDWALRLRRMGKSVLFIHHAGKGGQQRGTSKREDILDVVLALRPVHDGEHVGAAFEVHYEKGRHLTGDQQQAFVAELHNGKWHHESLQDSTRARAVRLKEDGLSNSDIAAELGVNRSTVHRALKKAAKAGEL